MDEAEADRQQQDHEQYEQHDAADPGHDARALRRDQEAHHPQHEQLAARRGLLSEPLHRVAQLVRPALGERQGGLHHLSQCGALLGMAAGESLVEIGTGGLDVVALRGPRPEDRLGGHAVLGLALQLFVRARLELWDRREGSHLHLHLHLLLLGHRGECVRRDSAESSGSGLGSGAGGTGRP